MGTDGSVNIQYDGWNKNWDILLPTGSDRLMKHLDKAFAIGEEVLAPWERKGQRN